MEEYKTHHAGKTLDLVHKYKQNKVFTTVLLICVPK